MLSAIKLKTALESAPSLRVSGVVARVIWERYRATAGSPMGASMRGGRYNAPGLPTLYTSFVRMTAMAEFLDNVAAEDCEPIGVLSMFSLMVTLKRVLDLTNATILSKLDTTADELCSIRFPGTSHPARTLGTGAAAYFDGLVVWSAIVPASKNLVIFPDHHWPLPYVVVRDAG